MQSLGAPGLGAISPNSRKFASFPFSTLYLRDNAVPWMRGHEGHLARDTHASLLLAGHELQ
jgi:hypothetical protein